MPFANVFGVGWVGTLAQSVCDLDALLWAEGEVLENVPAFGLPKTSTLFHDWFHEKKFSGRSGITKHKNRKRPVISRQLQP